MTAHDVSIYGPWAVIDRAYNGNNAADRVSLSHLLVSDLAIYQRNKSNGQRTTVQRTTDNAEGEEDLVADCPPGWWFKYCAESTL